MSERPPGERIGVELAAVEPGEMAEKAASVGVKKGERNVRQQIVLGVLAGAYIGLGGLLSTVAGAGAEGAMPFGATQILMGVAFSLGLILVLVGGAELFTGNVLMLIALAERRLSPRDLAAAWGVVYAANLAGSLILAALVLAANIHGHGDGMVGVKALQIAHDKTLLPFSVALTSGILANGLVCLAVWLYFNARNTTDMVLAIVPPITAFVAVGAEHSIANMYLIPFGLLVKELAGPEFWSTAQTTAASYPALTLAGFLWNLLAVTIGNIIGGAAVGLAYWLAYLGGRRRNA